MLAKRILFLLVIAGLAFGCAASAKRINNLNVGMTKAEVIDVLGEPNYTSGRKGIEILSYKLTSNTIFSDTYFVMLKEGKVDRFGRQGDFGVYY